MTQTVIGFFKNRDHAYKAVDALTREGFDISNIDISYDYGKPGERDEDYDKSNKITRFFKSLFSDDDDKVSRYSEAARDNTLLTVHIDDVRRAELAADILDNNGAIDINETGEHDVRSEFDEASLRSEADQYSNYRERADITAEADADKTGIGPEADSNRTGITGSDSTSEASIPIIDEEMKVGKREVRRGGVRIRSRIVERPVEETLRLREERVHVERNPVDRDVSDADIDNFKEETIEVTGYSEEPIVSKRSRVVEEVRVGKKVHEREETIRDKTRRTEVDVEDIDNQNDQRSTDVE